MGSSLFVIGLSWKTAPVAVREKLAFADDELPGVLRELTAQPSIGGALLISTCNRVEIYATTPRAAPASALTSATAEARRFLAHSRKVSSEILSNALYELTEEAAARHIFQVTAALDSMVVGESQIAGQLKEAFGVAVHAGTAGPVLGRCMERAFGTAKRVRTETGVARGAANVSSVAVELAQLVFGELTGKRVLVIGAGKMSALAARHLRAHGAGRLVVINRSEARARGLAREIDGEVRPWDELEELLASFDVVVTSTAAREPILTVPLLKRAMKKRRRRSLVIMDIAVPRDVEPKAGGLDGVYLFDVDDLRRVADQNIQERLREAEAAARIVEEEVAQFCRWVQIQPVVPTIRALREHFASVADAEVEKALRALRARTDPEEQEQVVRRLGELIINKLLHDPMGALKSGGDEVAEELIAAVHRLFPLLDPTSEPAAEPALGARAPVAAKLETASQAAAPAPSKQRGSA
jgi:glutamyl-tRNA reductase